MLDDGRSLAESNGILAYLAEGTPFLPSDRFERAQVLQWLFFEQYSHEPNIAVVIFWCNYAANPPPEPQIEARREAGRAALAAMERHLTGRTYLVGERCTIADLALYSYTHMAYDRGGFDLSELPAVTSWLARVAAEPGHIAITE